MNQQQYVKALYLYENQHNATYGDRKVKDFFLNAQKVSVGLNDAVQTHFTSLVYETNLDLFKSTHVDVQLCS